MEVDDADALETAISADDFDGDTGIFLLPVRAGCCPLRGDFGIACGFMVNELLRVLSNLSLLGEMTLDEAVPDEAVPDEAVLDDVVLDEAAPKFSIDFRGDILGLRGALVFLDVL